MHIYLVKATEASSNSSREFTSNTVTHAWRLVETAIGLHEVMYGERLILTKFECNSKESAFRMEYSILGGDQVKFTVVGVKHELPSQEQTVAEIPDDELGQANDEFQDIMKKLGVDPKAK